MDKKLLNTDPDIMGGTPVFKGTRVPVKTLFDWLETETLDAFLSNFPPVSQAEESFAPMRGWREGKNLQPVKTMEPPADGLETRTCAGPFRKPLYCTCGATSRLTNITIV